MKQISTLVAAVTLAFGAGMLPAHASNDAIKTPDEINAQHDMAKKKCDAMKGDQKDVCMEQADAAKDKTEAESKAGKDKVEADHDAAKAGQKADYDVAMEKCDAMAGDAKDACEADVKTRYGK